MRTKEEKLAYAKEWRKKNRDRINAYNRSLPKKPRAIDSDPLVMARKREAAAKWRLDNPEKMDKARARWSEAHPWSALSYNLKYLSTHPNASMLLAFVSLDAHEYGIESAMDCASPDKILMMKEELVEHAI